MTENQWKQLVRVVQGEAVKPLPVGFIIDSPWLPGWSGISIVDYFASEQMWFEANLKAVRRFPDVIFLPGFWSEYGMCTEPSAFGSKCVFHENDLPFADKIIETPQQMTSLRKPDVKTDGLLPFALKRLQHARKAIEKEGHAIKFAVARGPLNIASFLMGATEFMIALKESPQESHAMLNTITDFLCDWIKLQKETIPSIEGVFLLDDLAGFLGEEDFVEFATPYLKKSFSAVDSKVRFFHNDAGGLVCAPHLAGIGVNLFNFSFQHGMKEMLDKTGGKVCLLGNIPPRDVLASGKPDDVRKGVKAMFEGVSDPRRIIASCGGGMSQNTPTENIETFVEAVRLLSF
ncbi:MAG: uroporphyrinogen decarboxylase family protein [Kiritimatiellae bacterium]|nr:uroporphyrinogen decarboxylase family protein [Kiritimatiellia bacterium]MDD5519853.1 uroporphyrinogen decarboxylase family protein [Kiritimatiellia bacterium]